VPVNFVVSEWEFNFPYWFS